MKKRMIYHHPDCIVENGDSGSQVRPAMMLTAFKALGFEVDTVTGDAAQRAESIGRIKKAIRQGIRYEFLYSENRSIPTPLTEKHRFPLHPFFDHLFFRFCKKHAIPVGLFYRDIFWRFSMYKNKLSPIARTITIPLYWADWFAYTHFVDLLFLPSIRMAEHLPSRWPTERLQALPPGTAPDQQTAPTAKDLKLPLKLLYVGGVIPPNYDLSPMFEMIKTLSDVELTLVCRERDWAAAKSHYGDLPFSKINLCHVSGESLAELYQYADLFTIIREPYHYWDFAVPVKIYESIAHCLPIVIQAGSQAADIVHKEGLGWVENSIEDIQGLIRRLTYDRTELQKKSAILEEARKRHTWESRAETAALALTNMKKELIQ